MLTCLHVTHMQEPLADVSSMLVCLAHVGLEGGKLFDAQIAREELTGNYQRREAQ